MAENKNNNVELNDETLEKVNGGKMSGLAIAGLVLGVAGTIATTVGTIAGTKANVDAENAKTAAIKDATANHGIELTEIKDHV